jgi:hypothetical protein
VGVRESYSKSTAPGAPPAGLTGQVPTAAWWLLIIAALLLMLTAALGAWQPALLALSVAIPDGLIAAAVGLSAGGYGYLLLRRWLGQETPVLLKLATSAVAGLWLFSTAVMVVGSTLGGLGPAIWWPVVALGAALAIWQGRSPLRRLKLPRRLPRASLLWVAAALAAGIWLAGATLPAGLTGRLTADSYDVLEYHLQLPREYFQSGQVAPLTHNVYSHYPLGVEMLFLLGMCLRGGAYEGMYLATLMHGLYAAVMAAGIFGALRQAAGGGNAQGGKLADFHARAAALLLLTAPWVLYLSWLASSELAEMCCLALALMWLRQYLHRPGRSCSAMIGLMAGAACAIKYLSVGLIALPVLAVLLAAALWRRRPADALVAAILTAGLFSPWLARNVIATGNPVFPLANTVFGRGYLSSEQAQRWNSAHAPGRRPPAPRPPDYQPPPDEPSRWGRLAGWLVGTRPYESYPVIGSPVLVLLLAGLLAMAAFPRGLSSWDRLLPAVLAIQVAAWMLFTHEMPARFASVCLVPIWLVAATALARLAAIKGDGLPRQGQSPGRNWGMAPAVALLLATAGLNLVSAWHYYRADAGEQRMLAGADASALAQAWFPSEYRGTGKLALVGESRAFYFPPGTVYATVFDPQPLAQLLGGPAGPDDQRRLRQAGIDRVLINWSEIERLRQTYGWPEELSPDRLHQLRQLLPTLHETYLPGSTRTPAQSILAVP